MTDSFDHFDVIVVGVGAMGAAACYQLAKRGLKVLGLEQFAIGHDRGSSHGQSRMTRMAYYEHPDYVPLLRRAYELWDELKRLSGRKLLYRTGGLYMGPADGGLIAGSLSAARLHGLPHEMISDDELAERFAPFGKPATWSAMFEPNAGLLLPTEIIKAYVALAKSHGATIAENEAVLGWSETSTQPSSTTERDLLVRTSRRTYRTQKLLICGGAWSARLIANLGVQLTVTRQVLGWVRPANPEPLQLGKFPVWAVENPDGSLQYGFPILPGDDSFKVAWHGPGSTTDPDTVDRTTSNSDVATFLPSLPHILPKAFAANDTIHPSIVTQMQVCLYTNSPDHHFIIDRDRTNPSVTFACGFSGHGFKFASVIGEVLAQLAIDGKSTLPIDFLSLKRFT